MKHSTSTLVLTASGSTIMDNNSTNDADERPAINNITRSCSSSATSKRCALFNTLIMIILIVPIVICEYNMQPYKRGFFCNDESIRYPHRENTVSTLNLGLIVLLVPAFVFALIEQLRPYLSGNRSSTNAYFPICCQMFGYYLFGLALTLNATEIGKFTIGRLRPHFYAVCQPRMLDGSTCAQDFNQDRFIENYECTGLRSTGGGRFTEDDLREARLSFPSGHASMIWYCMVYLVVYIQYRLPNNKVSHFGKYLLQFSLLAFAWFVGLTRIMDNFHHWSDVLAGGILGIISALLTARYLAKLYMSRHSRQIILPHTTTPLTLKEISVLATN